MQRLCQKLIYKKVAANITWQCNRKRSVGARASAEKLPGGPTEKILKNSKRPKIAPLSPGGATEKNTEK